MRSSKRGVFISPSAFIQILFYKFVSKLGWMKIVLLAGGIGSRARPFSDYSPKALIPVNGKPLIDYIIRYVSTFSHITEIIIVCEFDSHGKQIINYLEGKERLIGKKIVFIEDRKKGTGGALLECMKSLEKDAFFMVWYADNLCALDINSLVEEYIKINNESNEGLIGIVIARSHRKEETGRLILDKKFSKNTYLIKEFSEKPIVKLEHPEASGIYLFNNKIMSFLKLISNKKGGEGFDLSSDILSKITINDNNGIYCYDTFFSGTDWIDIESPSYLERNKIIVDKVIIQMESSNQS
jgi:mannose-1-phosphate guanylyltransferase